MTFSCLVIITATALSSNWGLEHVSLLCCRKSKYKPYLPARPSICIISRSAYSLIPSSCQLTVFLTITRWQGRFTPVASVEVQHITFIRPSRNPFSIACLSTPSSPAWWNATPADKTSRKQLIVGPYVSRRNPTFQIRIRYQNPLR